MNGQFGGIPGDRVRRGDERVVARGMRRVEREGGGAGIYKKTHHVLHREVRCGGPEAEVSAHLEYPLDERGAVFHVPRGVGVEPPSLLGPLALPEGLEHLAPDVARRRRGWARVAESLAEFSQGASPERRAQRLSNLRGELGGLRLVELALPRAEAGGIGQGFVVADEEIVVGERVRLEPVRRVHGFRPDISSRREPAVHRGRGADRGTGGERLVLGLDRAKPEIDCAEHVGHGVIRRPSGVNHGRMRRRVLGARVYGEGCVPTFLGEVRETEKVLFSRTGGAGRESRIRRGYARCSVRAMSRTRRSSLGDGSQTTEPKVTRVETHRVRRMAGLMRSIAKTKFTRSRPEKSRAETGRCCMKSVTTLFVCRVRLKSQGLRGMSDWSTVREKIWMEMSQSS